jgi:hypothetical protein
MLEILGQEARDSALHPYDIGRLVGLKLSVIGMVSNVRPNLDLLLNNSGVRAGLGQFCIQRAEILLLLDRNPIRGADPSEPIFKHGSH